MTKIFVGYGINLLCLVHFCIKGGFRLSPFQIVITCLLFLIPFLGTVIYFIWYVWSPPTSSPYHLRQNTPNYFGKTEYGQSSLSSGKSYGLKHYKHVNPKPKKDVSEASDSLKAEGSFWNRVFRVFIALAGVILIFTGVRTMTSGAITYRNHWGLEVFWPVSILIGCIFIYFSIFKWKLKDEDNA